MRLTHDTIAALAAYKSARGLLGFDDAITEAARRSAENCDERPAWDRARAVADAVLYEGYLLYPYRATSGKNQSRWQFGVLGPPGAEQAGLGENASLSAQILVEPRGEPRLSGVVRFLQLQHRGGASGTTGGRFEPIVELSCRRARTGG